MKKLLSVFLALVLVLGCAYFVPNFTAHAASSGTCGDGLTWNLDNNGTLTISGSGVMELPSAYWYNKGCQLKIKKVVFEGNARVVPANAFQNCKNLESVDFGSNFFASIGDWAFYGCEQLTSISIPRGITKIGDYTFHGCKALSSVTFPATVSSIGHCAFSRCESLTSINLPIFLDSIGASAFSDCSSLTGINIPLSVTSIGVGAFLDCSKLEAITVDPQNENYYSSASGVLYSKDKTRLIKYPEGKTTTSVHFKISNTVQYIERYAVYNCRNIQAVTLPEGLVSIGYGAFQDCTNLISVNIPSTVTDIDTNAFKNCTSLTNVEISNGVTSFNNNVFSGCTALKSIDFPASVTSVYSTAFGGCTSLECVTIRNKSCSIRYSSLMTSPNARIWGYKNSNAQTYASDHGYAFYALINAISIPRTNSVLNNRTVTLTASFTPDDAGNKKLTWSSSDTSVATVDQNGNVTGIKPGTTVIKAVTCDGTNVSASCTVTVVSANITRLFGTSRYDTAIAISDEGWTRADTVVLANGTNYADALAGVPLAYKLNAPILLTAGKAKLETGVAAQIEKLGATKVVLLGGTFAISQDIENELAQNYTVERVFGVSRYDTALEISKLVDPNPETVFIVTGTGYADALSVSPYAAMKGYPIVYSNPNSGLTASTVEYLASTRKIFVIGGTGAVGQNTVDQIDNKSIERIFGITRYLTSYEIANRFADEFGDAVMFATGTNFPDALAGGVLGAKIGAPLLLTHPSGAIGEIKNFVLDKNPRDVYILGGVGAVPDSVIEDIFE